MQILLVYLLDFTAHALLSAKFKNLSNGRFFVTVEKQTEKSGVLLNCQLMKKGKNFNSQKFYLVMKNQ